MTAHFDLDKHLAEEHHISPLSTYLKEVVYGGNDGIVTTFAVVAGFAGAQAEVTSIPIMTVLLFGFANLFADGVSMALGNFLSTHSEKDVYRNFKEKELGEIRANKHIEIEESIEILERKGFTKAQAEDLVKIYATNENYWLEFMMDKELMLPNPEGDHPTYMALSTFFSFIGFGVIPLIPYLIMRGNPNIFLYSIVATFTAMLALGVLRSMFSYGKGIRPVLETLMLGGSAASVAYLVGTLFRI